MNGRRGAFLVVTGVAFALIGVSYLVTAFPSRSAAFQWLPEWADTNEMGVFFITVGSLVALSALLWRWLPGRVEDMAFGLISAPPSVTAIVFLVATFTGHQENGWVNATSYLFFAVTNWIVAGWPNPSTEITRTGEIMVQQRRGMERG